LKHSGLAESTYRRCQSRTKASRMHGNPHRPRSSDLPKRGTEASVPRATPDCTSKRNTMAKRGQNAGSIYRRKDVRWVACLSVTLPDCAMPASSSTARGVMRCKTRSQAPWQIIAPPPGTSYEHLIRNHLALALGKIPLGRKVSRLTKSADYRQTPEICRSRPL